MLQFFHLFNVKITSGVLGKMQKISVTPEVLENSLLPQRLQVGYLRVDITFFFKFFTFQLFFFGIFLRQWMKHRLMQLQSMFFSDSQYSWKLKDIAYNMLVIIFW